MKNQSMDIFIIIGLLLVFVVIIVGGLFLSGFFSKCIKDGKLSKSKTGADCCSGEGVDSDKKCLPSSLVTTKPSRAPPSQAVITKSPTVSSTTTSSPTTTSTSSPTTSITEPFFIIDITPIDIKISMNDLLNDFQAGSLNFLDDE
jgi:hypothetical protein